MITKLNDKTSLDMQKKYRRLFNIAYNLLKENNKLNDDELAKGCFTDLSEYYAHMGHYSELNHPQLLLLPLDESHFAIDTNTRTITVPPIFQNCSGVENDSLCETVLFTVDRYFDYVDLYATSIEVQWINANGKKGVSSIDPALVDYDTFNPEGKLRFGWPLTKEITEGSGSVEFAVRFYIAEGDNRTYILNTLPNTLPIRRGLNLNALDEDTVSVNGHTGMFRNFITNFNGPVAGDPTVVSFSIVNLKSEEKIDEDNTLELPAAAHTADFNELIYNWYKVADNDEGRILIDPTSEDPKADTSRRYSIEDYWKEIVVTQKLKDENPHQKFFYYDEVAQGYVLYETELKDTAIGTKLYAHGSKLIFTNPADFSDLTEEEIKEFNDITGKYYVEAINRKGNDVDRQAIDRSNVCTIYEPVDAYYAEELPEYTFITEKPKEMVVDGETIMGSERVPVTLTAIVTKDEHNPTLVHSWTRTDDEGTETVAGTRHDDPNKTSITTTDPGLYTVSSTATLNRKVKNIINESGKTSPNDCMVYLLPETPKINKCYYATKDMTKEEVAKWNPDIEDLSEWKQGGETDIVQAAAPTYIYLKVDLKDFTKYASEDITYTWKYQKPDATGEYITIDTTMVGENGKVPSDCPVNQNYIILQWGQFQTPEEVTENKHYTFTCEVSNTIKDKTATLTDIDPIIFC